jgi:tetratricopeptide (TPR) repeat protein
MQPLIHLPLRFTLRPIYFGLTLALSGLSLDSLACDPQAGRLTAVEGRVEVRAASGGNWQAASARQILCPGDQIAVRGPGRAAVVLSQDVLVRLDQNTTLTLPPSASSGELGLGRGVVHVISRFTKRFGVITPFVNALVDGTEFTVASDDTAARVVVAEGRVRTTNSAGEQSLGAGEASETHAGSAPGRVTIRPLDAVAWAIHYPAVLRLSDAELAAWPDAVRSPLAAARRDADNGRFREALDTLAALPEAGTQPGLAALKAGALLGLGQVGEARALIARFAPDASASLAAVEAVVLVARNDTSAAETAARRAVSLDARSAAAQLALSYALQSARQLPAALAAAEQATALDANDPLAWARRAELELSLGHSEAGGDSARRAVALGPDTPRARAMAAFARLIAGETDDAATDFQSALDSNDAEPLAHFGLGLALLRQGHTDAGRREVEIAALLDPGNAELRSYLGRAYMEEERSKVAGSQFELARRLDPASPTPWYFDAFRKLRDREPLAAIADGEQALALNNQRAVLRSTALLDQDRAARAASLGAAYQQVGFAAPAQVAAMQALDDDNQNAAAHRLLADAYADTPRYEGARLSELLQAQLRQPIGHWPLAPQFVMPAIPMLDGPRAVSPDEATAFFERKPTRFAASLAGGTRDTLSGSFVASHAWERAQLSIGAFDYRSRGLDARIADTHLAGSRIDGQFALTPRTMLLAEMRHTERSGGDQSKSLFDGAIGTLQNVITDLGRIGIRHELGAGEEFIAEVNTRRIREREKDLFQINPPGIDIDTDSRLQQRTRGLSMLYSRQQERLGVVAGASAFRLSGTQDTTFMTSLTMDRSIVLNVTNIPTTSLKSDRDTAFGYGQWRINPAVTVHGGVEYVRFDQLDFSQAERINGKLGIVARLATGTTLRSAFFQGVSGSKYDRESLAPTQFAGFNQVFDDPTGTRWRRAAIGLDQRFAGGITAGLEASGRILNVPMFSTGSSMELGRWNEQLHRAHVAVPFGHKVALSAEWRHEETQTELNTDFRGLPYKVRTDLVPLRLWLKTGPADVLVENWAVRQHAAQLDGAGSDLHAGSTFSTTNLRISMPIVSNRLTATLGLYNVFDRQFRFHNTDLNGDPKVPLFYPQRTALLQGHFRF